MVKDESAHLFTLLDGAMRATRDRMVDVEYSQAPREVQREIADLRSSQQRLLSLTPAEGIRLTELADRAGMTKQAMGEFTAELQRRGLLRSIPDPRDGRARLLLPTPLGAAVADHVQNAIRAVEREWRQEVGPDAWDAMRAGLAAVARLR